MSLVGPSGPTNSPLLAIVGEAPGKEEVDVGRPFVGSAGRLLTAMLRNAGIDRSTCYITNVMQERPPGNRFETFYADKRRSEPTRKLVEGWERLRGELAGVKPRVIIALGDEPLYALTGYRGISTYRGTMVHRYGLRVLPTYHPAYVLRQYSVRPIVEVDLRKAKRQAEYPSVPKTHFVLNPSPAEVIAYLRRRPRRIAVDIETFGNPPTTRCVGIAWSKYEAICIPLVTEENHAWESQDEIDILVHLRDLLIDPHVEKVLQNCPFDISVLERDLGLTISPVTIDTMFAFHTLYPELAGSVSEGQVEAKRQGRKGLDFLSSIYTDHPVYWLYNASRDEQVFRYNCMDCVVTYEVAEKIEEELKERNLTSFYQTHVRPAIAAVARMGHRGIAVDESAREAIRLKTEWEMANILGRLEPHVRANFNPLSPDQVKKLVYDQWGLPVQISPQTKRPTTDDDALAVLARKYTLYEEPINLIIEYRKRNILLRTFLDITLKDGRAYTSYNMARTVTSRLSSSKTIEGYGGNLQNIPRGEFRRMFVADPGKVLIKSDLSQAEYRVLIWYARIDRIIDKLINDPNFSIHWWNATENIYKLPREQITPAMYAMSKNGTYGANYGIGALKVSRMYNMDYQDAKMIIDNYHRNVPEIQGIFQREIREQVKQTRMLTNPLGRQRLFYGRMDEELFRAAYSHYCQSTVADLIIAALVTLDAKGVEVLLQVHDELVVQCPEGEVQDVAREVRLAMERPLQIPGVSAPLVIPCEMKYGKNWYDTQPIKV